MAAVTLDWQDYLQQACDLFLSYWDELIPLITHRFAVKEAEKVFKMYEAHDDGILKVIIDVYQW